MARWRLTEPHYLNVPGETWELTLTDRATGRPRRISYPVPRFLHPESVTDWNYQASKHDDGEVHVCWEGKGLPHDIVFRGDPTPGMLPLDDEAREISSRFAWKPTAGTDDVSQSESFQTKLLMGLTEEMAKAQAQAQQTPMAPGLEKFMEMMTSMMAQQTQILAAIAGKSQDVEFKKAGDALGEKPVEDDAAPLDEAEPTAEEIAEAAAAAAQREIASTERAAEVASRRQIR